MLFDAKTRSLTAMEIVSCLNPRHCVHFAGKLHSTPPLLIVHVRAPRNLEASKYVRRTNESLLSGGSQQSAHPPTTRNARRAAKHSSSRSNVRIVKGVVATNTAAATSKAAATAGGGGGDSGGSSSSGPSVDSLDAIMGDGLKGRAHTQVRKSDDDEEDEEEGDGEDDDAGGDEEDEEDDDDDDELLGFDYQRQAQQLQQAADSQSAQAAAQAAVHTAAQAVAAAAQAAAAAAARAAARRLRKSSDSDVEVLQVVAASAKHAEGKDIEEDEGEEEGLGGDEDNEKVASSAERRGDTPMVQESILDDGDYNDDTKVPERAQTQAVKPRPQQQPEQALENASDDDDDDDDDDEEDRAVKEGALEGATLDSPKGSSKVLAATASNESVKLDSDGTLDEQVIRAEYEKLLIVHLYKPLLVHIQKPSIDLPPVFLLNLFRWSNGARYELAGVPVLAPAASARRAQQKMRGNRKQKVAWIQ
jgi:hypothetical protein